MAEDSAELDTSGNGPPVASGLESLPQRDPAITRSLRHELRTPINQIIGYSEMLVEEAEAAQQTAFIPDLQKIGAAARRLLTVIDEVFESTGKQAALEATATRPAITEIRLGASGAEAGAATGPAPSSARLLVVDDNELNRDMLSRRLKARGYQVETAGSPGARRRYLTWPRPSPGSRIIRFGFPSFEFAVRSAASGRSGSYGITWGCPAPVCAGRFWSRWHGRAIRWPTGRARPCKLKFTPNWRMPPGSWPRCATSTINRRSPF